MQPLIHFTIITLFPEAIRPYLDSSMLFKAQDRGILKVNYVNLRDFGLGPHRSVDDTPYGGGDGMLLRCEPVFAAIESIKNCHTKYTSNAGLPELRKAIAEYQKRFIGVEYDPETEIVVTVGASEGIDLAMRTLLDDGDDILILEPSYVSYEPDVKLCGGIVNPIYLKADNKFRLTPEMIENAVTPKTKAILLAYPNNPTGAIMEREDLEKIAPVIIKHDLIVISDEIYSELTYGKKHVSIASLPGMRERTIVLNGFSKAFSMTGWRMGYFCAPKELAEQMYKIHQYLIMCASTQGQHAALFALRDAFANDFKYVREMRDEYDKRRVYMLIILSCRKRCLSCRARLSARRARDICAAATPRIWSASKKRCRSSASLSTTYAAAG